MSYSHRSRWNDNSLNSYKNKKLSCITKDEHKRRVRDRIDLETIPANWDEFKLLSKEEQERMAKVISVVVGLFGYTRTEFFTGVIMEYEWVLACYWSFICHDCGFPDEFCASL